jgi:hypothetical protein
MTTLGGASPGREAEPKEPKEPKSEPPKPEAEAEKKATRYMVLSGNSEKGPWNEVGWFEAAGQIQAKKQGAKRVGDNAPRQYFLAIPESSYQPKKPQVVTPEPQITF